MGTSAVLPWGSTTSIYIILTVCRVILGIGVGAIYPLSASITAEQASDDNGDTESKVQTQRRVGLVFSFRGVGILLCPLVVYLLEVAFPDATSVTWRIALLFGVIPGAIVLRDAVHTARAHKEIETSHSESTMDETASKNQDEKPLSILQELQNKDILIALIGSCLSWFCFDIMFYGNSIFTPTMLQEMYGFSTDDARKSAEFSVYIALIAMPAYFVSVFMVKYLGYILIQLQGLLVMGVLYFVMAGWYDHWIEIPNALLVIYGLSFFFANFGPHTTTFAVPAEVLPKRVRLRMHGIAAASGKFGAVLGTAIFKPIISGYGVSAVLYICGTVALCGALVTLFALYLPQRSIAKKDCEDTSSSYRSTGDDSWVPQTE